MTYYNENDCKIAAWLRELIKEGVIPEGYVDERSIVDVKPHELNAFQQHHFFAGIGGWAYALRLAGWADDRPVRTGSCPCQPFSQAGKQLGAKDERHLWPVFRDIITFGEATITFGEQVASPLGREWLAGVRADMEGLGYEVGAADLCAAGVSAPHLRQRLYWMAIPCGKRLEKRQEQPAREECKTAERSRSLGGMENTNQPRRRTGSPKQESSAAGLLAGQPSQASGMGDTKMRGLRKQRQSALATNGGHLNGSNPWSNFDICHFTGYEAGTIRRIEAGTFPLALRVPGDLGLLRGYGNSIVPLLAAEFIQACEEVILSASTSSHSARTAHAS